MTCKINSAPGRWYFWVLEKNIFAPSLLHIFTSSLHKSQAKSWKPSRFAARASLRKMTLHALLIRTFWLLQDSQMPSYQVSVAA
jgi:hypothetical protein